MVVGMNVVGIKGDVLKIFQERISHPTTESGITMKQNNIEMEEVYRINPPKPMKKNVISVVRKSIGYVPVVCYLDPEDSIGYFYTLNGVNITVLYLFEDTNGYHI